MPPFPKLRSFCATRRARCYSTVQGRFPFPGQWDNYHSAILSALGASPGLGLMAFSAKCHVKRETREWLVFRSWHINTALPPV